MHHSVHGLALSLMSGTILAGIALAGAELKAPTPATLRLVERYCGGDTAERAQVVAELDGQDTLPTAASVQAWSKAILTARKKTGPPWAAKSVSLLAGPALSDQARQAGKQIGVGSAPVVTVPCDVGEVRVAMIGKPAKGKPVLVYLHGGGNAGKHKGAHDNEMAWGWGMPRTKGLRAAPVKLLVRCVDDTAVNAWILDSGVQAVNAALEAFLRQHPEVDTNRIYLVGVSMGGFGIWRFAATEADRYAAVAGVGGGCTIGQDAVANLRLLPVGVFIGEQDTAAGRLSGSRQGRDMIAKAREEDGDGYVCDYREYPGVSHMYPDGVYKDIDKFLEKQRRDPYPRTVVWHPQASWKQRFYNLALAPPSRGGSVRAEMQADNTVVVTSQGISGLTLYLNDQLADLSRPVTVQHNGKEVFSGPVTRTLTAMLETLGERGDPGQYYTVKIRLP